MNIQYCHLNKNAVKLHVASLMGVFVSLQTWHIVVHAWAFDGHGTCAGYQ